MSLEQERAQHAWNVSKNCTKEFTNLAKGAPAMIMSNNLMPCLAFWKSKGGSEKQKLISAILEWLKLRKIIEDDRFDKAMETFYKTESINYRKATSETLEYLKWLRNFASANHQDEGKV